MIFNIVFWAVGGWFTWVAVGVGVVGAVGSYAASSRVRAPGAVQYQPVDPGAVASQTIDSDSANLAKANQLTSGINQFSQGQANSMMEQALPGWGKLQSSMTSTTEDLLKNPYDLPPDVQQNLERLSAEKGISAGTRGQFNDFSLMRDFGVNELQYGQSRINQASGLYQLLASTAPRVNPVSPMAFMVTPSEAIQQQQHTNDQNQAINQGNQNAIAAANNYRMQALSNSFAQIGSMGSLFSGAVGGGSRGGGGSGGGGGLFGGG